MHGASTDGRFPRVPFGARRRHEVVLCEKESELGGNLKSEQALPFKREMYELAGTYANMAEQAGVEIRLNTEVTKEYAQKEQADALIIAVGSSPFVPSIPGLDRDNVQSIWAWKEKTSIWWKCVMRWHRMQT